MIATLPSLDVPRPARLRLQRVGFALAVTIPALGAVAAPLYSLHVGPSLVEPLSFSTMLTISGVGIELGYHRYFSHQAFSAKPWLRALLAIAGNTAVQGPVMYWVAHHRLHHARSDREGDPHSPHLRRSPWRGFVHAHVGWIFASTRASPGRYARDILNDRALQWIDRRFLLWITLGLFAPALVAGLVSWSLRGAVAGFLWGGLLRVFVAQHTTYAVNSLCHLFGARPFAGRDQSRNIGWLVLPTFGGSLHNNHHAFPSTADNGLSPGELDPSALLLRVCSALGWVWDVKKPTPAQVERRRRSNDETKETGLDDE